MWRNLFSARIPEAIGGSAESAAYKPRGTGEMLIKNGLLSGSRWVKANASGGAMTSPRFLVLHDTAGRCEKFNSVNWFASKQCGTSAHFVVELDGTITQMVPTNKRAYHAGVSKWGGIVGLNSCSVGIEIVNPGKLDETGKAWFGKAAEPSEIARESTTNHGKGYWLPYTKAQIEAVTAICRAVVEEYPDCNEIVTHWQISPGRKIDTNPLFPLQELRKAVFEPTPGAIEHEPEVEAPVAALPTVKAPTIATEAARSKSVWALLTVIAGKVVDFFTDIGAWASESIGRVVDVIGPAQQETESTIAPLASLGRTLQLNVSKIAVWATIVILVVVIARHVRDKVELARTKQQVPGGAE
jgi:N-acetylmuramoyl-L-alanine amidase